MEQVLVRENMTDRTEQLSDPKWHCSLVLGKEKVLVLIYLELLHKQLQDL